MASKKELYELIKDLPYIGEAAKKIIERDQRNTESTKEYAQRRNKERALQGKR